MSGIHRHTRNPWRYVPWIAYGCIIVTALVLAYQALTWNKAAFSFR
jgi:hypothetical protein